MNIEEGQKSEVPPLSEEEKQQRVKLLTKIAPILGGSGIVLLAVTGGLCLSGTISLGGRTSKDSLGTFAEKLEFTVKYQLLGVFWLVFSILMVIFRRAKTGALNPVAGNREIFIKAQANVLQNSFEQFLISAFGQIVLISFIDGEYTYRTIPLVNFLFLIGRITFWLGYPSYRVFGLLLSLLPSLGMTLVSLYKFCGHLFS